MFEDDKTSEDKTDSTDTSKEDQKEDQSDDSEGDVEGEDTTDTDVSEDDDLEDSDEEDDDSAENFIDPSKLPKEVQPHFKRMQASFTRKMQGLSKEAQKIEAMNMLMNDPEFRKWIEERKNKTKNNSSDTDEKEDSPVTKKALREEMEKALAPTLQKQRDRELRQEAKIFKKRNPDWQIHYNMMNKVWDRYPNLSFQACLDQVKAIKARRAAKRNGNNHEEIEDKRNANVQRPNKHSARQGEKKELFKTIRDAFEGAEKKLGIKWRG